MKMKRWISMFCILTLLLPIFNIGVHAEEAVNETIYESEETEMKTENMSKQVYYKNPIYENLDFDLTFEENTSDVKRDVLSPVYLTDEAVVIAEIRNAMRIREKTYVVYFESDNVLDDTFLDRWIDAAMDITDQPDEGDYIRFHFGGASANYIEEIISDDEVRYEVTIDFFYFTDYDQELAVSKEIQRVLESLKITESMSDAQKVQLIYDHICKSVNYDSIHLYDENYVLKYTAYAAICQGVAVCQGYANLFYRMAKEVGLDVRIIRGNSYGEAHSWNIVKLDGKYYYLDATWDAGMANYKYFLKGSQNFEDHTCDLEYTTAEFNQKYPIATTDYVFTETGGTVKDEYQYRIYNGNVIIEKYLGTSKNITIPSKIEGKPVREIASGAFANNEFIVSVTIPASVTHIEDGKIMFNDSTMKYDTTGAFSGCSNLEKVVIKSGSKLTVIGDCAFSGCIKLTQINLPDTIKEIKLSAFELCENLTTVTLPEGLVKIGQNAFTRTGIKELHLPSTCEEFHWANTCFELQKITVSSKNPYFKAHEGVLYKKESGDAGYTLVFYPYGKTSTTYRVPDYAEKIWGDAFIVEPDKPMKLKTFYIDDCEVIGHFEESCISRIRCTIIPNKTNPYYQSKNNMILSKDGKILQQIPSSFTGTVVVPEGVERIGGYAGEKCSFTEVILPESVKEIGGAAFWYCPNLQYINIPKSVYSIEGSVFQECHSLKEIVIPEGVKKLDMNAFMYCYSLEKVYWPKSLKLVESQGFAGSYNFAVYYAGTEAEWKKVVIHENNGALNDELRIYYNISSNEAMCKHCWANPYVGQEPGCETSGYEVYTCALCDRTKTEILNASGHTWENSKCVQCGKKVSDAIGDIFADVSEGKWFVDAVAWAYGNGLLTGTSENEFSPNGQMTRGMLVTVLYRKAGRPSVKEENKFPDVNSKKYYASAITWASNLSLVSGYSNGNFGPEDSITREQIAKILYLYAAYEGYDTRKTADLSSYKDAEMVSGYAKKYMQWAVAEGLIKGSNGELNPKGNATRAEISAILKRFVEKYEVQ